MERTTPKFGFQGRKQTLPQHMGTNQVDKKSYVCQLGLRRPADRSTIKLQVRSVTDTIPTQQDSKSLLIRVNSSGLLQVVLSGL